MNTIRPSFLVPILAATLLVLGNPVRAAEHAHLSAIPQASKAAQTDALLRDLWLGHVFWVRNVVLETLSGNAAAAAAAETEVVANAHHIADAIEPFYSKAASDQLFQLLAGHYGAVKQYLQATVDASAAGREAARTELAGNAAEIARFLSGANPHLPYDAVHGLLLAHGGHHLQQIEQIKAGQAAQEARTWNDMKAHMYTIADALAVALVQQFPARFLAQAD